VTATIVAAVVVPAIGTAMVYSPPTLAPGPLALPPASRTEVITAHAPRENPLTPLLAGKKAKNAPRAAVIARRAQSCRAHATMAACRASSPAGSGRSALR
jgi:hypothetical protein